MTDRCSDYYDGCECPLCYDYDYQLQCKGLPRDPIRRRAQDRNMARDDAEADWREEMRSREMGDWE